MLLQASAASCFVNRGLLGNRAKGRQDSTGHQQSVRPTILVLRAGDHFVNACMNV